VNVIVWTEGAKADLLRHYNFLRDNSSIKAGKIIESIVKAGDSLKTFPKRGVAIEDSPAMRKLVVPCGKSGFTIHYLILDEDVIILRIFHGRENRPV
jgi:plasmid stabilization system protein ParE